MPADRADLASVLRLPGTVSRKPGCDEIEVTVETITDNIYMAPYLARRLPKTTKRKPTTSTTSGQTDAVGHWWVQGPIGAGNRHKSLIAAAGWCRHNGIARDDAIPTIRDIWQRHDPGQYTWDEALERLDDAYRRYPDDKNAATFGVNPSTGEIVAIPKTFSDAEVGEAFGSLLVGRYLYCRALGGWQHWDGRRWRRDEAESVFEEARRYVLDLGKRLFDSNADSKTVAAAARYRDRAKIDSIVTIARRLDGIAATASDFDRHPDLLNAGNGVIDLRTGVLGPHDPTLRITQCTNVDYRPEATHVDVTAVLDAVTDDVRIWLQRLLGYAASGHVNEDVMPVMDGNGSNGKTTLLTATRAALGDYASVADARLLMRSAHEEHPTLFADLRGRRLVTIEETAEGGSLRVEAMKFLTGGSPIKARFIRGDYFEFVPTHMLMIGTNHRPAVNSTEHATWRRLRLIPFPYRYAKPEEIRPGDRPVDLRLRERLTRREQREATLAWIVAGAIAWNRDGLGDCPEIAVATDAWRQSEDVILRFARGRLTFDNSADIGSQELYDEFREWCEAEGRPPMALKQWNSKLGEHDLASAHNLEMRQGTKRGTRWFGVRLQGRGDGSDGYSDNGSRGRVQEVMGTPVTSVTNPPHAGNSTSPDHTESDQPSGLFDTPDCPACAMFGPFDPCPHGPPPCPPHRGPLS